MSMHQTLGFPEKHPRWATDADTTLEPGEGRKDLGWPADNKAPARWMNWLHNMFSRWSSHIGMTAVANWFQDPDISTPLFVSVSSDGTNRLMTSPDGINWTSRSATQANLWKSVTYGDGLYVAVSNDGAARVQSSPDGITWTVRTAAEANAWEAVTWGNGLFVAVSTTGAVNRIMTSPDGSTWTARAPAELNTWSAVTFGNGLFVAVSADGNARVMTSTDGVTWTARTHAGDSTWASVTYGNGVFVAVSAAGAVNRVMSSPDGITWTAQTAAETNTWAGVAFGAGLFVAVASAIAGTQYVMTSPDGVTWTKRTEAEATAWRSVTFFNGLFVAVASAGTDQVMTSPDGITWTSRAEAEANFWRSVVGGDTIEDMTAIIYHPDIEKWLAASNSSPRSYLGTGGHLWSVGGEFSGIPQAASIGIDGTRFLVGDVDGDIQYSTTGTTWSQEVSATIGGAGPIYSVATRYPTDDAIMVLRTNSTVYRAMGGIGTAWSAATTPPAAKAVPIRILHREDAHWIAVVADAGEVVCKLYLSADDGDTWAAAIADPTATTRFFDAAYNPETATIVIVGLTTGGAPAVEYSNDLGSTWHVATIEAGFALVGIPVLLAVYYCGGDVWVACGGYDSDLGERANILISNDNAETWAVADSIGLSSFTDDLFAIACDSRKLICCGYRGVNLHSLSIK